MTNPAGGNSSRPDGDKRPSLAVRLLASPASWLALAVAFLAADYAAGPSIQFPIAFIFPVALAAWYRGWRWGVLLAIAQTVARFAFTFYWSALWSTSVAAVNLLIRVAVLCAFACLVAYAARQRRQIAALEGLLPVCAWCKRIRNDQDAWQPLDAYLAEHAKLSLTHGICPDCMRKVVKEHVSG